MARLTPAVHVELPCVGLAEVWCLACEAAGAHAEDADPMDVYEASDHLVDVHGFGPVSAGVVLVLAGVPGSFSSSAVAGTLRVSA